MSIKDLNTFLEGVGEEPLCEVTIGSTLKEHEVYAKKMGLQLQKLQALLKNNFMTFASDMGNPGPEQDAIITARLAMENDLVKTGTERQVLDLISMYFIINNSVVGHKNEYFSAVGKMLADYLDTEAIDEKNKEQVQSLVAEFKSKHNLK